MKNRLTALARDFWWTGQPLAHTLWADLDPVLWEALNHNPSTLLREVDVDAAPQEWRDRAAALLHRWESFHRDAPTCETPLVAYFCMEYGLHESLPIYSGGLGMLAGDHLRSASDIGVEMVAIGMFWREGYFRQLVHDGQQIAAHVCNDPERLAVSPVLNESGQRVTVTVPCGRENIALQAWAVQVGRVTLYLLDTNLECNTQEWRDLTLSLYGGDHRSRLLQEVVLGIGGVRMLRALGHAPGVWHMNEGHAAFLTLELWAERLDDVENAEDAWNAVVSRSVFTTHTPVPAGHDRFGWADVNPILGPWRASLGLDRGAFMDKGRERPGDIHEPLCMTVLGIRGSRAINGVSKLHGEVSREMWAGLHRHIDHITNGVHPGAWVAPETEQLWNTHLPNWRDHLEDVEFWKGAEQIPAEARLACRQARRTRLVADVRRRLGRDVLDPSLLTIGFARRFAPYKRGDLIFRDPDRLAAILDRGAQIVFAGKAHPRDGAGSAIVAEVLRWARHPRFRDRVVFVPDYDMATGRLLTTCCDVWLNNPRRPREASGTSGQKASLNGNLNLSILDGWWPEIEDGRNGWAIDDGRHWDAHETHAQDDADADALYRRLEQDVLPLFADPAGWAANMGHAEATCVPVFNTHRMVRDYARKMYR